MIFLTQLGLVNLKTRNPMNTHNFKNFEKKVRKFFLGIFEQF